MLFGRDALLEQVEMGLEHDSRLNNQGAVQKLLTTQWAVSTQLGRLATPPATALLWGIFTHSPRSADLPLDFARR